MSTKEKEEFSELVRFTLMGYVGGFSLGITLDHLGYQRSALGQWAVRTLSGEGESLFEGIYAIMKRLKGRDLSMAEAYGWGKFLGMTVPWWIDLFSRLAGVDIYGVEGFYLPYFYALSDQMGASLLGLMYMTRREGSFRKGLRAYLKNPVMLTSLGIVLLVPLGLLLARLIGFSPTTQIYTAFETMAANLCWLPPLVGFLIEKQGKGGSS